MSHNTTLEFGKGKKLSTNKLRKLVPILTWISAGLLLGLIGISIYAFTK